MAHMSNCGSWSGVRPPSGFQCAEVALHVKVGSAKESAMVLTFAFPGFSNPKGPRTQIMGFQGPNTIDSIVFGPETLLFGSLDP